MKIGFIDVSGELLEEEPDFFEKYLPDVKILEKYSKFLTTVGENIFRYKCEHEEFEDLNIGDDIPVYSATFERDENGVVTRRPFHVTEGPCDYCGKPVNYPFPIHPECGRIWIQGYENARTHYTKTEWHPIETAPKHGVEIITGLYHNKAWLVNSAYYGCEEGCFDEGWYIVGENILLGYEPTHWIPMPPKPDKNI